MWEKDNVPNMLRGISVSFCSCISPCCWGSNPFPGTVSTVQTQSESRPAGSACPLWVESSPGFAAHGETGHSSKVPCSLSSLRQGWLLPLHFVSLIWRCAPGAWLPLLFPSPDTQAARRPAWSFLHPSLESGASWILKQFQWIRTYWCKRCLFSDTCKNRREENQEVWVRATEDKCNGVHGLA